MNNSISIITSMFIFLFPYIGKRWFNRDLLSSTVVSLGLLGTFGGIMLGLWYFGVEKISESIPQLLEGLKTAFLTSIAGMTSSLILKLYPGFYGIKVKDIDEEDTEIKLLSLLTDIRDNTRESSSKEFTAEIRSMREQFAELTQNIVNLSKHEIEINTESLSKTLEELVAHLDHKLSEQMNLTLQEIHSIQQKQLECMSTSQEATQELYEQLKQLLQKLEETNKSTETFLNRSTNLNLKHSENLSTQLNQLGSFVQTTGEQFQTQLVKMEEKYERELSEMEKFTKTMMQILKKLSQDYDALAKNQNIN